jgi:small neutral amino acid transporter SnatA (MarC family)
MKTLIGGAIAATLGLIGVAVWFGPLMQLLAATIPAALLLGGCLAIYLGFDELKETWKNDEKAEESDVAAEEKE